MSVCVWIIPCINNLTVKCSEESKERGAHFAARESEANFASGSCGLDFQALWGLATASPGGYRVAENSTISLSPSKQVVGKSMEQHMCIYIYTYNSKHAQ